MRGKKSRKNTNLIAGAIAAAIVIGLKALSIESPIDETVITANIGMLLWWVFDRRKVDKKIVRSLENERMLKWRDPGYWTPWITIVVEVVIHFTGAPIPLYVVPVAGSIVASLFNRKGPRAPK